MVIRFVTASAIYAFGAVPVTIRRRSALGRMADDDHAVCELLVGLFPHVITAVAILGNVIAGAEIVIYSPRTTALRAGFPTHEDSFPRSAMPRRASTRRFAVFAAAALLLSGCSQLGGTKTGGGVEKPSIRVAILTTVDLATLWLAQEGGYFKAEGLEVQTDIGASGQDTLTRMVDGKDDLALSTYTLFFLAKSSGTADLKLISDATSASPRSNEVVTVPNSPVKTVNDLSGKRIAISSKNAASDVLTRSVMRDHGIDADKVTWVPMPLPEMGAALAQGRVDAAYQPEPFLTQAAKTAGAYPVIDAASGSTQAFPLTGYGATAKWARDHPKTLAAFQRAMLNATRAAVDRARVEPLVVRNARVDQDIASLMVMPAFGSTLDARRIQRVPDLLQQLGVVQTKIDASSMIAPQASTG